MHNVRCNKCFSIIKTQLRANKSCDCGDIVADGYNEAIVCTSVKTAFDYVDDEGNKIESEAKPTIKIDPKTLSLNDLLEMITEAIVACDAESTTTATYADLSLALSLLRLSLEAVI